MEIREKNIYLSRQEITLKPDSMLKVFTKLVIAGVVLLTAAASCEKADYVMGEDGWPVVSNSISEEYFRDVVDGFGWYFVSGYTIDSDGKVTDEQYYKDLIGGSTTDYFFEGNHVTEFWISDAYLASFYRISRFSYDESDNGLIIGKTLQMKITSLKKDKIVAIDYVGQHSDGTKVFVETTWKRMSEEQLEKVREEHPTDFNEFRNKR